MKRAEEIPDYDFEAAWNYLLKIKEGEGYFGFEKFFKSDKSKVAARCLLAEGQPNGIYALFSDDFFVEEIDTKNEVTAKRDFKAVLSDIQNRKGEWS